MKLKEPKIIKLILSPTKSMKQLKLELVEELKSEFEDTTQIKVELEKLQITNEMEANLSGNSFSVEPIEPELQAIINRTTRWSWNVIPTKKGKQQLHLRLLAYITVNNDEKRIVVRTFNKDIQVVVSRWDIISNIFNFIGKFVSNNWEWFWTIIIIPLFIISRRFFQNRRER